VGINLKHIGKYTNVSVVIPVYNSSKCLSELEKRLSRVLNDLHGGYEVILVDDGSSDDSWQVIVDIVSNNYKFRAAQLMKNCGQTRATIVGIGMATGDVVITMDDDLQHDPECIPEILTEMLKKDNCDCIYAYFPDKKHVGYRNVASRVISFINTQATGGKRPVRLSSFRFMRKEIARIVSTNSSTHPSIAATIFACTDRILYIPVTHKERFSGRSNYTLSKQFRIALDNICNVSMLPLRAISATGLIASGISAILFCYIIFKYLHGGITVAGWTSTVVLITFFSGLILLALGIIGEYMVRILREVQDFRGAPVRQCIGFPRQESPEVER
jgi:polyisoprenyl-phosphate glycosyltransferase